MKIVFIEVLSLAFVAIATAEFNHQCPSREDIFPCLCKEYNNEPEVTCSNIQNEEELQNAMAGIKGHNILSLVVENSNIGDVPGDLFQGSHIHFLTFSYTRMTSLGSDGHLPFAGLESSLEELTITEGFWDYEKPLTKPLRLSHLNNLRLLVLENNVIPNLSNDWFADGPKSLKELYIMSCLVKEIGDKAFASLENLHNLHFSGNSVTLPRSALPSQASFLDYLDLSSNQMTNVAKDLLTNLPSLKEIFLDDNAIRSIDEDTWKDIFPQLEFVYLHSNPLECDARMKWIFKVTNPDVLYGECALPEELNGRLLSTLREDELK